MFLKPSWPKQHSSENRPSTCTAIQQSYTIWHILFVDARRVTTHHCKRTRTFLGASATKATICKKGNRFWATSNTLPWCHGFFIPISCRNARPTGAVPWWEQRSMVKTDGHSLWHWHHSVGRLGFAHLFPILLDTTKADKMTGSTWHWARSNVQFPSGNQLKKCDPLPVTVKTQKLETWNKRDET